MSMKDLIRTLAATSLVVLDDIPKNCQVKHGDNKPFYDTTTGDVLSVPAAVSTVDLVFTPVGKADRARAEKRGAPVGDVEALALDVSQFAVKPAIGDVLTVNATAEDYLVVDVDTDEVGATYTLTLLRMGAGTDDDQT